MKLKNKISSALLLALLAAQVTQAYPLVSSGANQNFSKNQASAQMRDIQITENGTEPAITSGELKIRIPDTIEFIFDTERTMDELVLYGSAVDNGRVADSSEIYFTDRDKTLVIPILSDFLEGEILVVTRVYAEGFHNVPNASSNLTISINDLETTYQDSYYVMIQSSNYEDNYAPELPTEIEVSNTAEGVLLTWTDPTDLDLQTMQVLRGVAPLPVDGDPYMEIPAGEQQFLDTSLEEGETVTYILRSNDGPNWSENSEEYAITFEIPAEPEPEPEPEPNPEPEPTPETEPTELSDIQGHWAQEEIEFMVEAGIITGNPDGTFLPDHPLNRAEAAALAFRILELPEPRAPSEDPFADVHMNEWYAGYVHELMDLGVLNGNPDGTYQPAEFINRAEFLQLAMNLYNHLYEPLPIPMSEESPFQDVDVDMWYTDTILTAQDAEFVAGEACGEETCFYPNDQITRAEATKILHAMFGTGLMTE